MMRNINQPRSFYILRTACSGAISTYNDRGSKEAIEQKALMAKNVKSTIESLLHVHIVG